MKLVLALLLLFIILPHLLYAFSETSTTFNLEASPSSGATSSASATFKLFGVMGGTAIGTSTSTIVPPTSSGPNSPGTMADDATYGNAPWKNPSDAVSSNNVRANISAAGFTSHRLTATNFGFSLPTDATINGIVADVEQQDLSLCTTEDSIKIVKGGVVGSTNKSTGASWPSADAYVSYGSSSDLWGETWTAADINASNFGFTISMTADISCGLAGPEVDHMRITVYYNGASSATFKLSSGIIPKLFSSAAAVSVFTQRNYGWATNDGNLTTGGLRAPSNTAITSVSGDTHRLRMEVAVSTATLAVGSKTFTLQYKTLGAGCSAAETWTTLGAIGSGSIWRGYDNVSVADGATLTNNLVAGSNQFESYEEDGASIANPTAVSAGGAGEWDWVIENNGATIGQAYCFKMVKTTGLADLNSYTNYPSLTVVTGTSSGGGSAGGGESAPAGASGGGTGQSGGGSGDGGTPPPGGTGGGTDQGGGSGGGIDAEPLLFRLYAMYIRNPVISFTSMLGNLTAMAFELWI